MKISILILVCLGMRLFGWGQNIIQAEYFIDNDLGVGKNYVLNVTPAPNGTFPFTADLSGIAKGPHILYIRTKDSNGKWSLTMRKNIQVLPTAGKNNVTAGEYFFDTDPGFGAAASITIAPQDSIIMHGFPAIVSNLQAGYHKLFTRLKDDYNNWSLTARHNVEVIKDTTGGLIKMVEYFFDTDPGIGNCQSYTFASPAKNGTFTFTIPANQVPASYKNVYFRVKDTGNFNWSITQWKDSLKLLPLTLLDISANKQNNIASLNWKTTNEINTAFFNVQRSINARDFTNIGKVNSKTSTGAVEDYYYADDVSQMKTGKVYYRLQVIDIDQKFTFSNIRYVTIDNSEKSIVIYPNPAHNYFVIANYGHIDLTNGIIIVRDASGRQLLKQQTINAFEQKINIVSLSKGVYTVSLVTPDYLKTQKLLVQ